MEDVQRKLSPLKPLCDPWSFSPQKVQGVEKLGFVFFSIGEGFRRGLQEKNFEQFDLLACLSLLAGPACLAVSNTGKPANWCKAPEVWQACWEGKPFFPEACLSYGDPTGQVFVQGGVGLEGPSCGQTCKGSQQRSPNNFQLFLCRSNLLSIPTFTCNSNRFAF